MSWNQNLTLRSSCCPPPPQCYPVQAYGGGIYTPELSCDDKINHAMLVVGFNTTDPGSMPSKAGMLPSGGMPYWSVKNSWGTGWGDLGYARIAYDPSTSSSGPCRMYTNLLYPVDPAPYNPTITPINPINIVG